MSPFKRDSIRSNWPNFIILVRKLFKSAIYVNASSDRLRDACRGTEPSLAITEKKRWVSGHKLLSEARDRGEELPLVFAQYASLTFWAIAREITLHKFTTEYRFADLRPLHGYWRSDLMVESTGSPLPNEFIRSYALVRTPGFLSAKTPAEKMEPSFSAIVEGAASSMVVTTYERNPIARKKCLQHYGSSCFACGFSFRETYGESVSGCIHVHHLQPVATRGGEHLVDPIEDLRPVCPNCHAVLHLRKPSFSIQQLKNMFENP